MLIKARRASGPMAAAALLGAAVSLSGQTVSNSSDIAFGKIASGSVAGTVTVTPLGTRVASGGVMLVASTFGAARFTITGDPGRSFAILLPDGGSLAGAGRQLTLDGFQSLPAGTGVLDGSGSRDVYVGATLHLDAGTQKGMYSGSFDITVIYN